jgi:Zn-dependent protease
VFAIIFNPYYFCYNAKADLIKYSLKIQMLVILSLGIWLLAVSIAITIHEFAHALVADRLGDPTSRLQGRLSLNPLDHYDRTGTTLLLVTSILRALGAPVIPFGWAKPVEYDPYNLRHPRRDAAIIALAGPAINLLLAFTLAFTLKTFFMEWALINVLVTAIITVNTALAIFNLLPIHPLDGSKIMTWLLPADLAHEYQIIMHRYGFFILMALIIPWGGTSALATLISPLISFFLNILLR